MTGGSGGGFGSHDGDPVPADSSDERQSTSTVKLFDPSLDEIEIPRSTRPFRAWSAAHAEEGPSLWARFRGWLASLFGRKGVEVPLDDAEDETTTVSGEYGTSAPTSGHTYDDLEAPWGESRPTEDVASRRRSGELPHPDHFEPPWDDPSAHANESIEVERTVEDTSLSDLYAAATEVKTHDTADADEPTPPTAPSGAADPLWDEPRVASPADSAPGDAINRSDLDFVWSPKGPDDVDLLAESRAASESEERASDRPPAPKRLSFISKLFGRKKKDEQAEIGGEFDAPVDESVAEAGADETARQPAVDDFAVPELEPSIPIAPVRRDSLAHSAADAAHLAEFLSTPVPAAAGDVADQSDNNVGQDAGYDLADTLPMDAAPATDESTPVEAIAELPIDELPIDELPIDEPPAMPIEEFDGESTLESEPDAVLPQLTLAEPVVPATPPSPKKLGFFSQLLKRVSRSDFASPTEPKAEEVPARRDPLAATLSEGVPPRRDPLAATLAEESYAPPEPVSQPEQADPARWARPDATVGEMPLVEPIARVVEPEPPAPIEAAPEPYAFVDARDDFADEPTPAVAPSVESGRITEAVQLPVVDPFTEGEKTDEFEVVPAPNDPAFAETQMASAPTRGFMGRLFGRKASDATMEAAAVVADTEGKAPFVLAKFRMFYNEVIRDKHQKSDVISGFATAIVSAAAADEADPEFASQLLSKRLSEMLELQAAESNWTGGDAVRYYPEAQYAMVCLADETFLTIDWPGRPSWRKYMLEPKMYGTRNADTEFFRRVDKLLRDPDPPRGARDLARVYLLVIASGFRGLFREPGLKRPLAEYRRRLYEFSHEADPLELYARDRTIFPEAGEYTLAGRAVGRFTAAQKWIATVVFLIILYGTVSHVAWRRLSADLKDVMSRVETSTGQGGSTP